MELFPSKKKAILQSAIKIKANKKVIPSKNIYSKNENNRWLYLPIETKVRELDAKLLLTYYAVQQNYNVVIGLSGMIEQALEFLPEGIFLDKGYKVNEKFKRFKKAKDSGHLIINLDEEGFPLTEKEIFLRHRIDYKSLNMQDYEFCWGEIQKRTITDKYPFASKKCIVTGNPRLDLLNKKYRVLFNDKVEEIKKKHGDFILVNTKFPLYTKCVDDNGIFNEQLFERVASSFGEKLKKQSLNEYKNFIKMIKELSKRYPNTNIVVRPHPSDKFSVYTRDLKGFKNVFIVHEGNVINWILASKLVIHSGCTTGVESFLLEKPVISYISTAEDKYDLPNELSIKVYNLKNLFYIIDHNVENYLFSRNAFNENKKRQLLLRHALVKGKFAYENIITELNKVNLYNRRKEININSPDFLYKLNAEMNRKIYRDNTIVKQKFPSLSKEEIEHFFNKLNKIENINRKITVRKLHDKLFEIRLV